jgi:hypothetical protein
VSWQKHLGMRPYRFADNPEEERFARAWAQFEASDLGWLIVDSEQNGCRAPFVEERERVVAATVIQWLGSPVGQGFLRDLGYVRKP